MSVEDALASTTHQSYKFCRVWLREESNILQILIFFTIFSVCVYIYIFEPFLLKRKRYYVLFGALHFVFAPEDVITP